MKIACPYCGQDHYALNTGHKSGPYPDWRAVRGHVRLCKERTQEYFIDLYYGPIHVYVLNNYENQDEFLKDYPKFTMLNGSLFPRLRRIGKTKLGYCDNPRRTVGFILDKSGVTTKAVIYHRQKRKHDEMLERQMCGE